MELALELASLEEADPRLNRRYHRERTGAEVQTEREDTRHCGSCYGSHARSHWLLHGCRETPFDRDEESGLSKELQLDGFDFCERRR